MDTSSASTAQLTISNAYKILSPSNMQASSTEKLLVLRERGSTMGQSQLGLEIQQDQGISSQMKHTFFMENSDVSRAANNTSNVLNNNNITQLSESNHNNNNQLTVGIMETSMNLNQPINTTQTNILTTNPGENNNNNNLNIIDPQSSNSSNIKNNSAIRNSIITPDMRSRLKNKQNLTNRAKQGSSTQKIKDTPTNNNNQGAVRISTDTSESYFHLTQNNSSNPKVYPEPLLKLNNKKIISINDSFKDQSKQQSFSTTLQVPGMARATSRIPQLSISSQQKIPAGSPRKLALQSQQNQQISSSVQPQPSKGGSSFKRLFSFLGRRFNSRPSNVSNTPSSSQHNININNNNSNNAFNFNNSSVIGNQQGNTNLPGASGIHSMFQVVQAAALNENVIIPSSTLINNQLNQPNEINPGTNWNFVKKLAKVKKFIDSLKTANLYQSFYKVRSSHLSLISDSCDFSLYNDSKRAEFYYQMQQQSPQGKSYSMQSISFFSNLFGYVESGVARLPLFLPHQPLLNWFKVAMSLISVITLVVVPLFGCFSLMGTLLNNRYSVLFMLPFVLFFIEILISLNTAYYEEGDIQVNRVKIIKQYTKSALWIDLSSTFACVFLFADQELIFVLLVMVRILKVNTYRRDINEYFYIQQRANTLYTLVNLIVSVMIVAHYFACGFNYMAVIEESFFNKDSWIITLGIDQYSWVSRYINAVYFSFITMVTVGFGDIKPTTDPEKVYVTFVALTSSLIFAYTVNTIGTVFQEIAQQEAEYKSQKYHLSVYMRSRSINQQLQTRVMKYLDHMIHKQLESPQKGQEILKRMSKKIRDDIYKDFFGKILLNSKMFKFNFSEPFIKELTTQMKEIICRPGETIFSFNESDNRIFFINKGEVELFLEKLHKKDEQKDGTYSYGCLQKDDIFGEYSFFTSKLREMSAKSLTVSHLVYCTYEDFSVVLQQFPKDYEKFCQMKDEVMIYGEQLNTKCGACDKFRHSIFDCPYVHLVRRRENVIHKHIRSTPNERCTHDRQKGVKNNSLYMNLNVRIKLRKLRREYVESKFSNQTKKDEFNSQTININDKYNTNSNILLDDNKAGYNINLKRSELDDDSSQISVKSETKAEMRRFTDKKFFQTTPKLILDADYQIYVDREEEEVIEEFEDEDSEEEEEDGEYFDGSNSGNRNDFEEEDDENDDNDEEELQELGQDEMLGDVYDEDEAEESEFTSDNDSKGNSHNNSHNSDWREENEGHKDSIFKTLDAKNKRKLKEQQETEGQEEVNDDDGVLKNEFTDLQGISNIIKKNTNSKATPRMVKSDNNSQENDCQEDNSSSKSSSEDQQYPTSRGQADQKEQDDKPQVSSSRSQLEEAQQSQPHQEISLTSFGELLVDQNKKSTAKDKKNQLIFKGSVFQLRITDLATQQQKRAEQARDEVLNFEKLPEEEEQEDEEIEGNFISEFSRNDQPKRNRQANSQYNSNQPPEMIQRSMTIYQKATIFHNKPKSLEKSQQQFPSHSGKPLKHQRSLTDSPLFSSTIAEHRGLKRSSLSSSNKQYQLAKRASASSFNQLASFQILQMNNQQQLMQQKQQELEQYIQEKQRESLTDENQVQPQQSDVSQEKKRISKRLARQSSFQKGMIVGNSGNSNITKNFSSRSIDHPGILKHKIDRMGSMALNSQDILFQTQQSQSFLQQQVSPPNQQFLNNNNNTNPNRPILLKSENISSFQQQYPGKEADVLLLRRKTEKKTRNSQFITPQFLESPGLLNNNQYNNNNAQIVGLNSNRMSSQLTQAPPEVMVTPIDDPRTTNLPLQRKSTKQSIISSEYLQLPDNSVQVNGLIPKSAMPPVNIPFNPQQQIPIRKTLNFKQTVLLNNNNNNNNNEFGASGWLQTQNSLQNTSSIQQQIQTQGSSPQNQLMSNVSPYKKSQSIIPSAKQQFLSSSKSIGSFGVNLQQPSLGQNPNNINNPMQQLQSQKSLQSPQIMLQQQHIQGIQQQQQQQTSQQQLMLGQNIIPQVGQNMMSSAPSPGGGVQGQPGQIGAYNMWAYPQQPQQPHSATLNHLLTAGTSELGLLQEEAILQSSIEYHNHKALFWYDFDKMKEFTNYFPHNNYTVVCKDKRKQLVNRKNYFANRKFLGPSTRNLLLLASKQQQQQQQQAQLNQIHPSPKGILGNINNNSNMSLNQSLQGSIAKSPNLLSASTKLLQTLHANPSFSALLSHHNKNNKSTKNLFAININSSTHDPNASNNNISTPQLSYQGSSVSSSNEPSQLKIKKTASKLFASTNNNSRSFRLNNSKGGLPKADSSPIEGESFNSSKSITNPIKKQMSYKISEIVPIQQSSAENTERHESYRPTSPPDNLKIEDLLSPGLDLRLKDQTQKLFMGGTDGNVKTDSPLDM